MNFQGPRDFTTDDKHYQQVVAFLLDIQNRYPEVFKTLLLAPQFEHEVEICRRKKRWARTYLLMLKNCVKQHEFESHPTIKKLKVHKSHVPALS